jgi:transposase
MKILALDLGKFNTMCCFFDSKTRKHAFLNASTDRNYLETVFKQHKGNIDLVVMEACGPSGWINDLALSFGLKTLVCSTNEDAWRWSNVKRKTDKDDALKLARMAAMRELKSVHMPAETHREFRALVKYRKTLDQRVNKMKCTIRAWFVNHGITIDAGEKAWHTGRERLDSFRKPLESCNLDELWKGELDIELTQLDALTKQMDIVIKRLDRIGKQDRRIQLLMTIPGVGARTAEILVACIDDPHRFQNGRQVAAYFGLVPRQFQSGETDRNGRITKRGNPLARTILTECAWASLRYNPWAKAIYERIYGKQKTRKKKAAIALARKIAVLAWAMLRDNRAWDPSMMIKVTESYGRMNLGLKESLQTMKPKENSDQRKSRLRKEARAAKETTKADRSAKQPLNAQDKPTSKKDVAKPTPKGSNTKPTQPILGNAKSRPSTTKTVKAVPKPRRARKLVSRSDAGHRRNE